MTEEARGIRPEIRGSERSRRERRPARAVVSDLGCFGVRRARLGRRSLPGNAFLCRSASCSVPGAGSTRSSDDTVRSGPAPLCRGTTTTERERGERAVVESDPVGFRSSTTLVSDNFNYQPIFPGVPALAWLTKFMLQAHRLGCVDRRLLDGHVAQAQDGPEQGPVRRRVHVLLRPQRHRPGHDRHDCHKFLPFLLALFSFVLVNNLWGIFPLHADAHHRSRQLGLRAGGPGLGALQRGRHREVRPWGYLKARAAGRCTHGYMWPLIIPLEFASNIIVRPVTLSFRLFANMFAGHLLVLVFVLGGAFLLFDSAVIVNKVAGGVVPGSSAWRSSAWSSSSSACKPSSSPC